MSSQTGGRVYVLAAHPNWRESRVNRLLLEAAAAVAGVQVADLYGRYPDYDIDVKREQAQAEAAQLLVLLHPIQWYSMPALMKLWLDEVLRYGWAYGRAARRCTARTCGWWPPPAALSSYHPQGYNRYFFDAFLPPYEQTAHLCGCASCRRCCCMAPTAPPPRSCRRTCEVFRERLRAIRNGRSWTNWAPQLITDVPAPTDRPAPGGLMEHAPAWLTNSLIYLSAAVIAVPLSRAIGLGSILGYLAAGIAIGPWGLGLVPNVEDILHFAEFGVVLMLFLIGLELEPRRLWNLRRPIFGWGSVQVLGCAALLFAADGRRAPWRAWSRRWARAVVHRHRPAGDGRAQPAAHQQRAGGLPSCCSRTSPRSPSSRCCRCWPRRRGQERRRALGEALRIVAVIGGHRLGGRLLLRPLLRWIAKSTPEIFTAAACCWWWRSRR